MVVIGGLLWGMKYEHFWTDRFFFLEILILPEILQMNQVCEETDNFHVWAKPAETSIGLHYL